ncbi:MAG: hypothetical protein KDK91_34440, partial [Gammaproteobacteria bacterium]|nr:hypothetical protein [Gammaproteobacteria bacterium]
MNDIIAQLIERADAHREADEYIAGTYGDLREWEGGCAIGCAIHDLVHMGVLPATTDTGDHAAIAEVTGIPEQLLQLEDAIFENLPDEERPAWPGCFLRAAHGRDLSMAWPKFALWLLSDPSSPMYGPAQDNRARNAIAGVADLYREWVDTGTRPPKSKWAAARAAA